MPEDPRNADLPPELGPVAAEAADLGLELRAVLPAEPLPDEVLGRVDDWLASGGAEGMDWLRRGRPVMADLRAWKPWAGTVLLFTAGYGRPAGGFRGGGRVARYALGRDYHHTLGRKLARLGRRLAAAGRVDRFRAVVDAAPVLEREWALRGLLGFRGKNTLVLDAARGPWQLLAELVVDSRWPPWTPDPPAPSCGSCRSCLDRCPTGAFPEPWVLRPQRCISFLTIEWRGAIDRSLRPLLGDWVFGCDRCLEVCPFGGEEDHAEAWGNLPALERWSLEELLAVPPGEFEAAFRGSPIRRAGWAGLLRNACVALGNLRRGGEALERALRHPEPLVRGHAAWALGRLGWAGALRRALAGETEHEVRRELEEALDGV